MSTLVNDPQSINPEETTEKTKRRFSSEGLLSALVALLSILTAVVAFHASRLDSDSNQNESFAMQALIESNQDHITAFQDYVYDQQLYDQWLFEENEEKKAYFYDVFTPELRQSIDENDILDSKAHYNRLFANSEARYDESIMLFNIADEAGNKADNFQIVVMLFALGLAFAGWASLVDESKFTRTSFTVFSLVMLVIGSGMYIFFTVNA